MSLPSAYAAVIIIWATTPIAIKWSGEGASFLFGVAARMSFGALLCLVLLALFRIDLPWRREARLTYLAAGMGIYGAMLSVYWAAQFIPSGLISVLFGLAPFVTGLMASAWLCESSLTAPKVGGMLLALFGLALIFAPSNHSEAALSGLLAVLFAVLVHSASAVWVKRIGADVHPMAINAGALLVAVPLYLLTWAIVDGAWPADLPERTVWSIAYLGVFGTVVGFYLYFYALKHSSPATLSLITLVTPVLALWVGEVLNGEQPAPAVWWGTLLILIGLFSHQLGERIIRWARRRLSART